MDLNIQIPDNTASIFEYLQKGLFISSNSTSEEVRDMYNEIDENYESLYQYFSQINYTLERGNEYFFFSRIEPKATLEQKIMRAQSRFPGRADKSYSIYFYSSTI